MEYNLEKINKIKENLNKINTAEKPPIVLMCCDAFGQLKCLPLTDTSTHNKEVFYICSQEIYNTICYLYETNTYYLAETLDDAEVIASFIVEHYFTIYKE